MMLFLCAEERGRTPARSIDAAIVKESAYGCDCRLTNGIYRHNSSHHLDQSQRLLSDYVLKERKNQMRTVIDVLSFAQKMF